MKDIMCIKVTGVKGARDGDTGYVSIWPIFDRQDWVNVEWSDGVIETVHPGEIIAPDETNQIVRRNNVQRRLTELSRMPKTKLLIIMYRECRQHGVSYVIGGPATWSKDELINGILFLEFSETG